MKRNYLLITILASALLISCGESDDSPNPITINDVATSKKNSFTDEPITISLTAEGYDSIEVTSSNNVIIIDKIDSTNFEITSSEATEATIKINFISGSHNKSETVDLTFYNHGITGYHIIEGIRIDQDDTTIDIQSFLGAPDGKFIDAEDNQEEWYYFDRGLHFRIDYKTKIVYEARAFGSPWFVTLEGVEYTGSTYPYEIGDGMKVYNEGLTMNNVLETIGAPETIGSFNSIDDASWFDYTNQNVAFIYKAITPSDYTEKPVFFIALY